MNNITQIITRRQAVIKYSEKKGVTAASVRYNVSRATIYRWKKRYDGTPDSFKDRSHRPHSHPNRHTEEEIKLIKRMRKKNKHTGLVVFWVKLRQKAIHASSRRFGEYCANSNYSLLSRQIQSIYPNHMRRCYTRGSGYR